MAAQFTLREFSSEEKAVLTAIMRRKLFVVGGIYAGVVLVSVFFIVYFSLYSANFRILDNLEVINVVFAIIGVLCLRQLLSEIVEYRRETRLQEKRVALSRILEVKDGSVKLGSKSFDEDDFLFGVKDFDSLKAGDNVEIEISARSNMIFSIKRI